MLSLGLVDGWGVLGVVIWNGGGGGVHRLGFYLTYVFWRLQPDFEDFVRIYWCVLLLEVLVSKL